MSLGALSRSTIGASTAITILPCLFCLSRYHDAALPFTSLLLLMPALLVGTRVGRRRAPLRLTSVTGLASAVSVSLAIVGGVSVWWTWPAWYLVIDARRSAQSPAT